MQCCLSCSNGIDEELVDGRAKLQSPFADLTLHKYYVNSSMAFGSGFHAIQILPSDAACDYTSHEFFRFSNSFPFSIKWKNKDTLLVKRITDGQSFDLRATQKKFDKWEDWIFESDFYLLSSTEKSTPDTLIQYNVGNDSLFLTTVRESFAFRKDEVSCELDSTQICLRQFLNHTSRQNKYVALKNFTFITKLKLNPKHLPGLQVFTIEH